MLHPTASLLLAASSIGCFSTPAAAQESEKKTQAAVAERLPPKLQLIQKELPAWLEKTGSKDALALMQTLGEQVKSKQFEEADKTADSLLKMMGRNAPMADPKAGSSGDKKSDKSASSSTEETTQRLTEKVERVKAGAQKWVASGRDPAEIIKTMQEKFQPLIQAGKIAEAEAVVDGVLKQLGLEVNVPTASPANEPSAEERVLTRVHTIQKELPAWVKKTGNKAETDALMQKLKAQLAEMNFVEAEKTADAILKLLGLSIAPVVRAEQPPVGGSKQAADPLAVFFPQQLVFLASTRIALKPEQRETLLANGKKTQPRQEELKVALERESAELSALTSQARVDEATIAQLNKYLDVEREARQLQVRLGVTIHNVLTGEQQATLRELIRNPNAVAQLEEEFRNRITEKVALVEAGAQKWAQGGRDPSPIAQAMEQEVRPLMDGGRVFEAETEIDHVLEKLNEDSK